MELQQEQERLQKEMVQDFEQKIEKLKHNKKLKRQNILKFYDDIRERIHKEKEQKLQEVIKKIVVDNKEVFERFGAKLGNASYQRKYAKELTQKLLTYLELPQHKQKQNKDDALDKLLELIKIDKNYYKSDFIRKLKEDPQKVFFITWPISANKLAAMTLSKLMELFTNDKLESKEIDFQTVADKLGEYIIGYLRYMYNDNEKIESIDDLLEITIGAYFVKLVIDMGYVEERLIPDEKASLLKLFLSKEFLKELGKTERDFLKSAPFRYEPMVIEPLDWQGMRGGGYLQNHFKFKLPLMKMHTRVDREYLSDIQIPQQILDAVNFLQKVPYTINTKMLDVLLGYQKELKYIEENFKVSYKYYFVFKVILSQKLYEKPRKIEEEVLDEIRDNLNKRKRRLTAEDKKIIDDVLRRIRTENIEKLEKEIEIEYELAKLKNSFIVMLDIAQKYKEYDKIYFCWNMDFRGRIYPIQSLLHPQGGDVAKSLLLFANEQKLDENGIRWFKVHGANVFGEVDKEPFDTRVAWVQEHESEIIESATNPKEALFWKEADDPFKFLAFCFEYKRYKENPTDFATGLPVAIDGSNNGFQHISTMLRDTKGATSVNVLPNEEGKVRDFYMDVLEELKRKIKKIEIKEYDEVDENGLMYKYDKERDYRDELPKLLEDLREYEKQKLFTERGQKNIATHFFELFKHPKALKELMDECEDSADSKDDDRKLLRNIYRCLEGKYDEFEIDKEDGKIVETRGKAYKKVQKIVPQSLLKAIDIEKLDRKFIKKPTMTHSYGSGTKGKAQAIREYILSHNIFRFEVPLRYRPLLAKTLAELVEEAIESISSSSVIYRDFMKECAEKIAQKNRIVSWNTPLGLEVKQLEFKQKSKRILGNALTIRVYERDENGNLIIDVIDQQKGLPPNFVHSIDATHLYMTLLELKKEGIDSIATVHDSFATTADNVERLSQILRKTFIELHRQEILKDFKEQMEKNYEVQCKEIQYVDEHFDFDKINDAIYMFS